MIPSTPNDALAHVRLRLREALGRDTIADLHRERPLLDTLAVVLAASLFLGGLHLLATLPFGWVWLMLFVLQGFLLQLLGLVSHDLFVHRRVWGERGSWLASVVLTLPRLSLPTGYEQAHLAHHRWIGTDKDTEAYKQHLNTRQRRLLFSTMLGIKIAQAGQLERADKLRHYHDVSGDASSVVQRARVEKWLLRGFLLSLPVLCWAFPQHTIYGYLLPVLVMGPIVNTLRIILEHADANPDNPFNWSTWYSTGPVTRLLFFWDSGDCHVIHHIYPRLPFYNMSRAVRLMEPVMVSAGVVQRHSFLQLLKGWFIDNHPHRSLWPLDGRPQQSRSLTSAS